MKKPWVGYRYNFMDKEWFMRCGCCNEPLFGKTKTMLSLIRKFHTKNECLGGW